MSFSEVFIRRPVATTLLTLGPALAGLLAYGLLPAAPLPEIDFPAIQVAASLPGASPDTMSTSVAAPLERQFARIAGVTELTSTSTLGATAIALQFDLDRNIDGAARDVQAAINAARGDLPRTLPYNPTYRKVNPADAPILILAMTSSSRSPAEVYDAASSIVQEKLSRVPGVGQVFVAGGALPAVRVELDPAALARYGIGLSQVRTMLAAASVNRPRGQLSNDTTTWELEANDQLQRAAAYARLVVAYRNGRAVLLRDVGQVRDSIEDVRTAGLLDGRPAAIVVIFRRPGANIIEAVDRVRARVPELRASIPSGIDITMVVDRSTPIRASLKDVKFTLVLSVVLVTLVVFVFLRNLRSTLIPGVAVPVSLVTTFGLMYLFGFSLNNLSLMALTIATGFVIDDAIVVLENVTRYREAGMSAFQAAMHGAREIGFTVLSMSLSLVAVFIPILFMGGIVGRIFREFAVTLSAAVGVSLLVSLTTTPMMCARLPESHCERPPGRLSRAAERTFSGLLALYERTLDWVLRHPRLTLGVTVLTVALNVVLLVLVPKGFFPQQDGGRMAGGIQASQDISFQAMSAILDRVVTIIKADPAVDNVIGFTGGLAGPGGASTVNTARLFVGLKPIAERRLSADQVIGRLRGPLSRVPGASTFLQAVQDLRIGARVASAQYQVTLQGQSSAEVSHWGRRMFDELGTLSVLVDLNSDQQDQGRQARLVIDRRTAARLGITAELIDQTLYDAFGQRQVSTVYTPLNQYHVIMEVAPHFSQRPEMLRDLYVQSATGQSVPLGAFTRHELTSTVLAVNHQSQLPSVTFSFNLPPGVALGDAVNAVDAATRRLRMPSSLRMTYQGTAQAFQASLADQPLLILAALATIYIVLGMLYESYVHPLTILSTLPSAGVGAILALLICGLELSVIALLGIILLIGIVKKNAIMMIDFALDAERREGKSPFEAIRCASLLRFRPILMTSMAALLGALPLAVGRGVGAELRRPLGVAIVGGLIVSQLLTLYTTPVVYLFLDNLRHRMIRRRHRRVRERGGSA